MLKLNLETVEPPDFAGSLNAWRSAALYRVLYEFPYQDSGGAQSLIARIPIEFEPETPGAASEETVVTDELTRWDDDGAPPLILRGAIGIASLDVLSWFAGQAPTDSVSLARTFDGATGPPVPFASLDAFLDAVAGPAPGARHASVAFTALPDFLAAMGPAGTATLLGDWDEDGAEDPYLPRTRTLVPPVLLREPGDRFEITYDGAALDRPAVVYLRATRG